MKVGAYSYTMYLNYPDRYMSIKSLTLGRIYKEKNCRRD
jgi:hypothetical protein